MPAVKPKPRPRPSRNGRHGPRVYIGMPAYQITDPRAVIAGVAHASAVQGRTEFRLISSGFHASNFNSLWCQALNTRKELGWTHFAMIHQDVNPAKLWVDTLLAVMQEQDVDMVSVVLPQKNPAGITSTGALNKDTLCSRRLTMREVVKYLPLTFQSKDLAALGHKNHHLLASSGLWICDFTRPWVERVWFETPSRIIQDEEGQFLSAVWSEDWNFSLQMYAMGLKIASTRIVPAVHIGNGEWGNDDAWGQWETDCGDTSFEWALGKSETSAESL